MPIDATGPLLVYAAHPAGILAVASGPYARTVRIDMWFLGEGTYNSIGGFVGRFMK